MSEKKTYRLTHRTARKMAITHIANAPDGYTVTIAPPRRSDAQSARMHAMAGELSKQVLWCGARLDIDDWKRVATAMLKKDKFVRDVGEDGQPGNGLIVVGARTSQMTSAEMGAVIDWFEWFGAQHGVVFAAPDNVVAMGARR